MAFTVTFDGSTEDKLKKIKSDLKLKTKVDTLRYLIHSHENVSGLLLKIERLNAEVALLKDVHFIGKIAKRVKDDLSETLHPFIASDKFEALKINK